MPARIQRPFDKDYIHEAGPRRAAAMDVFAAFG
jgi:hypothetical protein